MMIELEKAIQNSTTRPSLSVHHTSFLWALLHELVRSTTQRFVAPRGDGLSFSQITPTKPRSSKSRRVAFES
jgi:hypothetical protein